MLFDLRGGHRRNVVKVVYAVLAILMGASLFLTVGPFSIAEIFNGGGSSSSDLAKPYEEEAERIEARLKKDPENPNLLISLTRSQINAGNAQAVKEANGEVALTPDSVQAFQEADQRIAAAAEAQKIVAEGQPSASSLLTLAFYTYFTGDTKAAEQARAEAKKLATSDAQSKEIDKVLDEYKNNASKYLATKENVEKEAKAAGGKAPESLENPLSPGLGTGGLGG